jgi:hypothetical protein
MRLGKTPLEAEGEITRLLGSKTWEELDIGCDSMRGSIGADG